MITLLEISEGYRRAAILVRLQLDEARRQLREAEGTRRAILQSQIVSLNQTLVELRDLRDLTAHYYDGRRSGDYTTVGLRAGRKNALK